jgi:hypothetical protein
MMGFNIMSASHFDEYLVDFASFKAGPIDPSVFQEPALCDKKKHHKPTAGPKEEQQLISAQVMSAGAAVMPWARVAASRRAGSNADAAALRQQSEQQLQRLAVLARNSEFVQSWNQGSNAGFKLDLNRFADWLPEEYQLMRGKRSSSKSSELKQVCVFGGGGAEVEGGGCRSLR